MNAPTKCARSAVRPLTADALASGNGHTVPHPAYIPGNGPSARVSQFPNVFPLKMKFSAPKIQLQKINLNIGEYSDFETPGGPPLFYPLFVSLSHLKPLSHNAFINSILKINTSKLPQFSPKKPQFFYASTDGSPGRWRCHRKSALTLQPFNALTSAHFANLVPEYSLVLLPSVVLPRRMGGAWSLGFGAWRLLPGPCHVKPGQSRSTTVKRRQGGL